MFLNVTWKIDVELQWQVFKMRFWNRQFHWYQKVNKLQHVFIRKWQNPKHDLGLKNIYDQWLKLFLDFGQVQDYAAASVGQGAEGGLVDKLAAAGAHGKHASSIHRALVHCFGTPLGAPEFMYFRICLTYVVFMFSIKQVFSTILK